LNVTDEDARLIRVLSAKEPTFPFFKTFVIWVVLADLIRLGVVLAMLSVCTTPFEIVVVSGLVLIYNGVRASIVATDRASSGDVLTRNALFIHLFKLLNDPEVRMAEEGMKEAAETVRKMNVAYHVDSAFRGLTSLFALWKLIRAIWPTLG
jgi:hypothetical protein